MTKKKVAFLCAAAGVVAGVAGLIAYDAWDTKRMSKLCVPDEDDEEDRPFEDEEVFEDESSEQ